MLSTLRYIADHPFNRGRRIAAFQRFAWWQLASRASQEVVVDWVEPARLALRRRMVGATGNLYCGLHEFADMAFVLHFLRPDDLFLDVGANVGSYTVLASKVCGARTVAFEPAEALPFLHRNIAVNGIGDLVTVHAAAVGDHVGTANFTRGRDAMNRVCIDGDVGEPVPMITLDSLDLQPTLIKLDVEGGEEAVVRGGLRTLAAATAILTETNTPFVADTLKGFGFEQRFYDPRARRFVPTPTGSNVLYLRHENEVLSRLASAPKRNIFGDTL